MTEEIERLKEQRKLLWREVKCSHTLSVRATRLASALNERYKRDEKAYEECDRALALLDGRLTIEPIVEKGSRKPKGLELTAEQMIQALKDLGVKFPEEPGVRTKEVEVPTFRHMRREEEDGEN